MKRFLTLLALCALALPASAAWTYDSSAMTLTSADGSVVLNNVKVWSGKQLTIGDNGGRADLTVVDLSDGVADGWTIRSIAGKSGDATMDAAFDDCDNLTTVVTGDELLDIGERAFDGCDALQTVHIGKNCTSLGWGAFRNAKGPMQVTFEEGSALTTIGDNAFSGCTGLVSIDFSNCAKLATIKGSAFSGCTSLAGLDFSPCPLLTTIGEKAFFNCSALTTFAFAADCPLTSLPKQVFEGCSALTAVDLSVCSNLTSIAEKTFLGNKALARVDLPASLATLPIRAFDKHRSLAEGAAMLHVWFRSCPISDARTANPFGEMFGSSKDYTVTETDMANASVTIHVPLAQATAGTPNWNTWAGDWKSLADASGVCNTDSTKPVLSIPASADETTLWVTDKAKTGVEWDDAAVIVSVWEDPVQVEVSGPQFTGVFVRRDYTTAQFTATVTTYDTGAADHVDLTVTLYSDAAHTTPVAAVSHDVSALGVATAFDFTGLAEDSTYYAVLSGVDSNGNTGDDVDLGSFRTKWEDVAWTYYPDKSTLEKGWIVVSNVTASGTSLSIAKNSNNGDPELPDLDFTGGIRDGYELVSVGEGAFANCTALTNVVLPATVTTISGDAFRYDTALLSFAAPGPVSIGSNCFYDNDTITNVSIPNVVSIGHKCFQTCEAIRTLGTDLSSLRSISQEGLSNCKALVGDFVMTNLTSIGTWLFNGSSKITSVVLGEGVTQIPVNTFQGCDALTNVTVKGELTKIDSGAFGSHGPYNSHCSAPGHLNIYLTNVPDTLGNPFGAQYWNGNMAGIDAAASTIVVHLPYYNGLLDGKNASDGTTEKFAAWAKAWQQETLESIVARGCPATTFELPQVKSGSGQWRNDTTGANTAAYVVRLAYYTDPNQQNAATILLIK